MATQQKKKTKNNPNQTHQFRKADHNGSIAVRRDGHSIGAADFLTQGFTQHAVRHGCGGHLGDLHGTVTCTTKQRYTSSDIFQEKNIYLKIYFKVTRRRRRGGGRKTVELNNVGFVAVV